jgi:hypothetical protein
MEINMSPNLTPGKEEYAKNSLVYEQLVFNAVNLIGASNYDSFMTRFVS